MMVSRRTCFFVTLQLLAGWGLAEELHNVRLRMEAAPQTITIGDPIKVEITVITSTAVTPAPFALPASMGEFESKDLQSSTPKKIDEGKISITHTFWATTFSTGPQKIPALTLAFTMPDGNLAQTQTEEMTVQVRSLLTEKGDEGGLRPLKGFYNYRSYTWLWVLLSLLLAGGLVWWARQAVLKKRGTLGQTEGPPIPPEQRAWEALHRLEDSDLIENGQFKEFYSQLSVIIRDYLERRYEISALERTSTEILSDLRKLGLTSNLTQLLREFFETGDLVKFAKFTPDEKEVAEDLNRIKEAITVSTPKPVSVGKESSKEIPV